MMKVVQDVRRADLGKSGDFPQSRSHSLRKKDIATEMEVFQGVLNGVGSTRHPPGETSKSLRLSSVA